jgi:hypothetical protein
MKAANSTVSDDDDDDDDDSKLVSIYFTLDCRFNLFDLLNAHESHLSPTNSRKMRSRSWMQMCIVCVCVCVCLSLSLSLPTSM